jgi:4-diphosphocytidyl-2-C-methyl-D-erythritol kinase
MKITLKSPAKINWFLYVTGKRWDGYHNLFSLMQKISLYDTISLEPSNDENIHIISNTDIPIKDNLIYRAAVALKNHTGHHGGATITLHKEIPLEAGLGGGSSNAATTLLGLNKLWDLKLSEKELIELASGIGSDVPFFISKGPTLVEGKGEKITQIVFTSNLNLFILIVKPDFGVSTSTAYKEIKSYSKIRGNLMEQTKEVFIKKRYDLLSHIMRNDLEEPVFRLYPELKEIKNELLNYGALGALLSGSGSSLFGVFKKRNEAEKASEPFKNKYWIRIVMPI